MYETISVLLLMQSYDDFHSIPRIFTDSSPTCMDKRLNLGQIGGKCQKVVQTFYLQLSIFKNHPLHYWYYGHFHESWHAKIEDVILLFFLRKTEISLFY